jgi:hypothetical protein
MTTAADATCVARVGAKPSTTLACSNSNCYRWVEPAFGACSVTCGWGTQTRTISCWDDTANVAATNAQCAGYAPIGPKKATIQNWSVLFHLWAPAEGLPLANLLCSELISEYVFLWSTSFSHAVVVSLCCSKNINCYMWQNDDPTWTTSPCSLTSASSITLHSAAESQACSSTQLDATPFCFDWNSESNLTCLHPS